MSEKPTYQELEQRIRELEGTESKNDIAEIRKRSLEDFFNLVFEKHHAVMLLIEPESGVIINANIAAQNYYGYSISTLKKIKIQRINTLSPDEIAEKRQQAADEEKNYFEFSHRLSSGEIRLVEVHSSPIILNDKKYLLSVIHDITERKKVLDSLENERGFLSAVLDNIEEAIVICNAEGQLIRFNESARRLHGIPEKPITPDEWSNHYDLYRVDGKTSLPVHEIPLFKALRGEKVVGAEIIVAPKNSKHRYMVCNGQALYDHRGENTGAVIVMHDLTEQKMVEDALRESEVRYKSIFANLQDVYYEAYMDGTILEVSPSIEKLSQYKRQELIGKSLYDIYADPKERDELVKLILDQGKVDDYEIYLKDKDGSQHICSINTLLIRDNHGRPERLIGSMRDISKSKQAEEALRESEEKFRLAFHTSPDSINLNRLEDGVYIDINDGFTKIMGYTRDEVVGKSSLSLNIWENPEDRKRLVDGLTKTGYVENMEAPFVGKDGKIRYGLMSARITKISGENIIISITRDITERKQAEKKLRESEEKFRLTFDASPDSVNINRLQDGLYVDINRGFTELTGFSREDVIGKTSVRINIWDDINDRKKLVAALENSGFCENLQAQFRKKDGSITTALMSARVIQLQGEPHIISITRDISERIKIDRVIRENELKFRSLYELSPQAIALTGIASGELLDVNDKLCELTKYSREEIIGKTTTQVGFYDEKDRRIFIDELKTSGQVNGLEMDFFAKDGSILTALMFAKPINIMNEPQLLTIFYDITEQKHLQKKIAQAQKIESIGNLAGGIAHDFNNILSPIIGMSEMLIEDLPSDSPEQENAGEIFRAGIRGRELVKQILAFSRQSEHKMIPTRVQHILKEVLNLIRSTIPTNIQINQDIQSNCGLVMADPTQIHQIAMNIATNAYHAVSEIEGGVINVQLKEVELTENNPSKIGIETGRYAVLSISDNGHGMSADIIDKIFDPYFTTKEQGRGTGLGLAVVYGIVQEHKGTIKVYSEVGKGATFDIYLPLMDKPVITENLDKSEQIVTGSERILLVDDEAAIAKLEKLMLERLGYHVTSRLNSIEALEAFKAQKDDFDLVITDMSMPHMTGDQLAKELISIRPDIPIIICTGFSEKMDEEKAKEIGVKGLLMKPVVKAELTKMIRKVLDENKS